MNARCKIMLVDGDPILCKVIAKLLEANGYFVLPYVHTYEDAKKQLLFCEPDIVLLDICLSGEKDGIELATYIYQHTQIPVVFITGYTDAVTLLRAKKSRPRAIVLKTKPLLDKENLVTAISDQLLTSLMLAAPDENVGLKIKSKGLLLKVTEKKIEPAKTNRNRPSIRGEKANKKTLIPFDNIQYISSNNKEAKNTILIKPIGDTVYVYRDTLMAIEKELPDYFVKVKDSHIINIKMVTQCVDNKVLFIDGDRYDVSENYMDLVYEKKRIYLSHLF